METAKQVSIFLENKPGRLASVLAALAKEKVNIAAMSVMDKTNQSVLRVVTDDLAKTAQIVKALGTRYAETDVLIVDMKNHPGALAHVCELLGAGHINIDYCYCSAGGPNGRTVGIFKVSNTDKATKVLSEVSNNLGRRRLEKRPPRDRRSYQVPG